MKGIEFPFAHQPSSYADPLYVVEMVGGPFAGQVNYFANLPESIAFAMLPDGAMFATLEISEIESSPIRNALYNCKRRLDGHWDYVFEKFI